MAHGDSPGPSTLSTAGLPPEGWAFGAERSVSVSGHASVSGNATYSLSATFGWHTVLSQTSSNASAFQLEANRTSGGALFVMYCKPDCVHPVATLNITGRVWETEIAFANFTSAGTVTTATGPVPALAIRDSAVRIHGDLSEQVRVAVQSAAGPRTGSATLHVESSGHASVSFSPALGLVPEELTYPTWNSSASYRASGAWSLHDTFSYTSAGGLTRTNESRFPGSFSNATGTVTIRGGTVGSVGLDDGSMTTAVRLEITGPFAALDGFILLPDGAAILNPHPAGAWGSYSVGSMSATTSALDFTARSAVAHPRLVASSTSYSPTATDSGAVPLALASVPPDSPGSTLIQGQPEAVPTAQAQSRCLIVSCPSTGASALDLNRYVAGGALLGVIALGALAVVSRRRPPRRSPPSPNARLYPTVRADRATGAPDAPASRPTPESDPLDNLW